MEIMLDSVSDWIDFLTALDPSSRIRINVTEDTDIGLQQVVRVDDSNPEMVELYLE